MVFHAPLDLYYWFVTFFSGSISIFIAVAFIGIGILAARFRMPNEVTIACFALFAIFLFGYLGELFVVFILILGLVIGLIISKMIKN